MTTIPTFDVFAGCLLGGAIGDALGASIEFNSLHDIRSTFGPTGITSYAAAYGKPCAITDDTQMALFTAEAFVIARRRDPQPSRAALCGELHRAYLRWLITQDEPLPRSTPARTHSPDEWLLQERVLFARRGPGTTCLAALRSGRAGTTVDRINDSKGCGGVMRAAPAALFGVDDAFVIGCDLAAITHGHPSGYLSSGVFAAILAYVFAGASLLEAVHAARQQLLAWPEHHETLHKLDEAVALGANGMPTPEQLEKLGGGWVGEEALAIAIACALAASTFDEGVIAAVNHSGDSDSTGAIAGNVLGALYGAEAIASKWTDSLEARDVIQRMARSCVDAFALA